MSSSLAVFNAYPNVLVSALDIGYEPYRRAENTIGQLPKNVTDHSILYHPWNNRLSNIMNTVPMDISVIYNVKDFLNQVDQVFLEYLDIEDIVPTPYGTITLDFEHDGNLVSVEMGETKIAFFTDFKNKQNSRLDGTYYMRRVPHELKEAFSRLLK